ncbi:di-trans,poly-cis-decaprenylcistransferase [Candidatus Woesebacteria bacterium GWC2_33_12]|uniref:Isoprenyl transferase n=1 Tax=Candidatus Woesebacteria bacterium GW2011_GWB1_33_22 TaxID=1618566 RepID=A0A0F9ZJQ7_9BACT|nr:MAG: Isoprenyl transferase [Candidatus Woesebacteria bacterium GW2011_GWC2_33_12]KKP41884.1 MAG: Isoprenyl transferase [Candidatus Woesebacteria bacterium GW2011_GWA2_33_20]KKP44458.1 MAG: Isoprenyl transferase [Candidatus Woesebacteria bacterium GW2011_GWB1_33_22]KKP46308.1 MAG: Isoprenyl transferase [Microgenomates group bacterium GW2011_GWC1_33_28]KKP50405.1 MAG: Isoprenyl transferase [Candidatus Woesebacteria bacterium GW2011_GWA1_33_33]OGM06652.1 MAG: di-trans,poly-cis-decaprenylcistra
MSNLISLPKGTVIPNHIAMILDGNRRWARARGLKPWEGHYNGYLAVEKLAKAVRELGIHTFTVWAWSTENWDRPQREIDAIMDLFRRALKEKEKEFHQEKVALVHLGRKDRLPKDIQEMLIKLEKDTAKYSKNHIYNLAVDYGGRSEIVRAVQKAIESGIKPSELDEKSFEKFLDTYNQPYPNPDLFIRTSGEQRTSGLMPWQMVYAEYLFSDVHLPDFSPEKLKASILDFSRRRRRFGGNDAMEHFTFDPHLVANLELKWWRLGKIPQGVTLLDYSMKHVKEQFGLSKKLARQAAKYMLQAGFEFDKNKLDKAKSSLKKFYKLIKFELKLAFEPEIVATLEVEMRKHNGENEELEREHLAEVYRISLFQAAKVAHLRVLANVAKNRGDWKSAENYLEKYYSALKERVA